jgi:uncharacterized protein (DUF1778 family)
MTREKNIGLRVSEEEHLALTKAAQSRGLPLSAWLRLVALDAAKQNKNRT